MAKKPELLKVHFCIPPLKAVIVLAEDWEFGLRYEERNRTLAQALGLVDLKVSGWGYGGYNSKSQYKSGDEVCRVTLPQGTQLSVDRIYIRQGSEDFNSVTFRVKDCSVKAFKKCRFWAKLGDVNKIVCFPVGTKGEDVADEFISFATPGVRQLEL